VEESVQSIILRAWKIGENFGKIQSLDLFIETAIQVVSPKNKESQTAFLKANPLILELLAKGVESSVVDLKEELTASSSGDPFIHSRTVAYLILGMFTAMKDEDLLELMKEVNDPSWRSTLWGVITRATPGKSWQEEEDGLNKALEAAKEIQDWPLRDNVLSGLHGFACTMKHLDFARQIPELICNPETKNRLKEFHQ